MPRTIKVTELDGGAIRLTAPLAAWIEAGLITADADTAQRQAKLSVRYDDAEAFASILQRLEAAARGADRAPQL